MTEKLISVGQSLITQEEYDNNKAYYDKLGFVGKAGGPVVYNGDSGSDYYDTLTAFLDTVQKEVSLSYKYRGGSTYDPMADDTPSKVDNPHFVTWLLHNSGISSDITAELAKGGMDTLLYGDVLDVVNPLKSASDDFNAKLNYLALSVKGDILFFDTVSRNSSVGIYLGVGKVIMMLDSGMTTVDLWVDNELDGSYDFTFWMEKFNGTIKRLPILNKDDYVWHAKIME